MHSRERWGGCIHRAMAMNIEVDQSGKIERTSMDTVLAFSNGLKRTLLIRATVKRQCISKLRQKGVGRESRTLRIFSSGLFILLQEALRNGASVTIDTEYTGREGGIKGMLLRMARQDNIDVASHQIRFKQVGKKSPAHKVAIETFRGRKAPDQVATVRDIFQWL